MKLKRTVALLIAAVLTISGAASGSAAIESVGDPGKFWSVPNNAERGQVIMQFLDSRPGEKASMLLPGRDVGRWLPARQCALACHAKLQRGTECRRRLPHG